MDWKKIGIECLLLTGAFYIQAEAKLPDYYQADKQFVTEASGENVKENEDILFDFSHLDQGYFMVKRKAKDQRVVLQLTGEDMVTYTYYLNEPNQFTVIPLTAGDGAYQVTAYVNLEENQYVMSLDESIDVVLENQLLPFLYPSQYVKYDQAPQAAKLAKDLTKDKSEAEAVEAVFAYVTENISYDFDKAESVQSGYLPDIDETLQQKKGICFDYSALMTGMLRSVGIPTRLDIGYSQDMYHAWISVYFDGKGWVNNMVEFDGENWNLMDPTLVSTNYSNGDDYVIESNNYILEYVH